MTLTAEQKRGEMNEVAKIDDRPVAPVSDVTAIIQVIERAALNPDVDVEKMDRLLQMQERIMDRNARAAYMAALVAVKPKLPVIDRKGRIEVRAKDAHGERTGKIQQSTPFARWEDIDEAIAPILNEHGLVLSFRTGVAPDGKVTVTGILSHAQGHSEETTLALPHDSTGSKNSVQAVGSTLSYGKRYTATLLLNIRTRGEDDDGQKGGDAADNPGPAYIDQKQIARLQELASDYDADMNLFLQYMGVERLEDIPAAQYPLAFNTLKLKAEKK